MLRCQYILFLKVWWAFCCWIAEGCLFSVFFPCQRARTDACSRHLLLEGKLVKTSSFSSNHLQMALSPNSITLGSKSLHTNWVWRTQDRSTEPPVPPHVCLILTTFLNCFWFSLMLLQNSLPMWLSLIPSQRPTFSWLRWTHSQGPFVVGTWLCYWQLCDCFASVWPVGSTHSHHIYVRFLPYFFLIRLLSSFHSQYFRKVL